MTIEKKKELGEDALKDEAVMTFAKATVAFSRISEWSKEDFEAIDPRNDSTTKHHTYRRQSSNHPPDLNIVLGCSILQGPVTSVEYWAKATLQGLPSHTLVEERDICGEVQSLYRTIDNLFFEDKEMRK